MTQAWMQRDMRTVRARRTPLVAGAVLVILAVALFTWMEFFRREAPPAIAAEPDQFLFGSIGNERADGIPYWVWLVLPRVFPDRLPAPGGYATLGFLSMPGRDTPAGFSKATIGYDRVALNCAGCHVSAVRPHPGDAATIVPTSAAASHAPEAYLKFLVACASDPRFTAGTLLAEIAKNYHLSAAQRLAYRLVVIPATKRAILRLRDRSVLIDHATLKQHAAAADVARIDTYLHSLR